MYSGPETPNPKRKIPIQTPDLELHGFMLLWGAGIIPQGNMEPL